MGNLIRTKKGVTPDPTEVHMRAIKGFTPDSAEVHMAVLQVFTPDPTEVHMRAIKGFTPDSAEVYVTVEDINKRSLGKMIVKVVGNEGRENTEAEQVLRRQIQTCITHYSNYPPDTWADARVTFLGMDGSSYVIQSGDGKKRIIVRLDARDKIKFVDFQN